MGHKNLPLQTKITRRTSGANVYYITKADFNRRVAFIESELKKMDKRNILFWILELEYMNDLHNELLKYKEKVI